MRIAIEGKLVKKKSFASVLNIMLGVVKKGDIATSHMPARVVRSAVSYRCHATKLTFDCAKIHSDATVKIAV